MSNLHYLFFNCKPTNTNEFVLLKYGELETCLVQVAGNFNSHDIDPSFVLPLLQQCYCLTKNIVACEINSLRLEAMNQVLHQLIWQHRTITEMAHKDHTSAAMSNLQMTENNSQQVVSAMNTDKERTARRRAIEATRQVPCTGSMDIVAGLAETKNLLNEAILLPIKFPQLFTGSLQPLTRILLYGPPGTGKTQLINAFASQLNVPFYSVTSTDMLSTWVGESEKLVRELFEYTREETSCCVIFIDEVDSICRKRTSAEQELTRRMKTELLTQMDKCHNRMFLLCATNCPWDIDPAFLRRFQKRIYVPLPERASRLEILRQQAQGTLTLSLSDADWQQLLVWTEGFSGCDLTNLANSALMEPLRDIIRSTSDGDLPLQGVSCLQHEVPTRYRPQMVPRSVTLADFETALRTSHRTVSNEDLVKFKFFTERYGQVG